MQLELFVVRGLEEAVTVSNHSEREVAALLALQPASDFAGHLRGQTRRGPRRAGHVGAGAVAIAEALVLSEHTVRRHVANILRKLDVSSRTAAAALAGRQSSSDPRAMAHPSHWPAPPKMPVPAQVETTRAALGSPGVQCCGRGRKNFLDR